MPGSLPTSRESVVRSADTSYFAESEAGFGFDPMEEEGLNSSYTSKSSRLRYLTFDDEI